MKTGLIIAMAALGLAVFAVPDTPAQAWGGWHRGPDVNQRLSGSTFSLSVDAETGNTTALQNLLAKGQPGWGRIHGLLEFEPVVGLDPRCPAEFPLGASLVSFEFVETFNDGSLLTGAASTGQAVCSDGVAFAADIVGVITGGAGRFDGAQGEWKATALTPGNNGLTGTLRADLD